MGMKFSVIKEDEFIRSEWSGGTTEQIFIYPPDAVYKKMDFLFRISRASVDISPSEFTKLPGIQRFIMPLDNELVLTHDNITDTCLMPFEVYEFPGDINTVSKSPAKDFNLMLAKGTKGNMSILYLEAEKTYKYNSAINIHKWDPKHTSHTNGRASEYGRTSEKYFIGLYTIDTGVTIDIDSQSIDLPARSLFLAESGDLADINIRSKMDSRIIMISILI